MLNNHEVSARFERTFGFNFSIASSYVQPAVVVFNNYLNSRNSFPNPLIDDELKRSLSSDDRGSTQIHPDWDDNQ